MMANAVVPPLDALALLAAMIPPEISVPLRLITTPLHSLVLVLAERLPGLRTQLRHLDPTRQVSAKPPPLPASRVSVRPCVRDRAGDPAPVGTAPVRIAAAH